MLGTPSESGSHTPPFYAIAVPLNNDGVFYQFVLELRAPVETVVHNRALGKDHILKASTTRGNDIRIYVKHSRDWVAGHDTFVVRHAWDPFFELHPPRPKEENKINPPMNQGTDLPRNRNRGIHQEHGGTSYHGRYGDGWFLLGSQT